MVSKLYSSFRRRPWLPVLVFVAVSGGWIFLRPKGDPGAYLSESRLTAVSGLTLVSPAELAPLLPPDLQEAGFSTPERWVVSSRVRRVAAGLLAGKDRSAERWRAMEDEEVLRAESSATKEAEDRVAAGAAVRSAEAGLLTVRARASSPSEAALVAAAVSRAAAAVSRTGSAAVLEAAARALDERLRRLREAAAYKELDLGEVEQEKKEKELLIEAATAAMAEIDRETEQALARRDRVKVRVQLLEGAEHRLREALPAGSEEIGVTSPVLKRLREDMDGIHITIAQERLSKTPEAPRFRDLMRRLNELEDAYRAELYRARARTIVELRESMASAELELEALAERRLRKSLDIALLKKELQEGEPRRAELAESRREVAAAEDLQRRLARAREARQGLVLLWTEAARPGVAEGGTAGSPVYPGILAAILLALASAFVGAGDTRVRTDADVKASLNLPSLGVVPASEGDPHIHRRHPQDPLCELYATAATLLRSYLADHDFKTCFVTGSSADEGKTTVASNLAVALARKGVSVALVDADLRRPRLHEVFGLDAARGLTTLLRGEETEAEAVLATLEIPTLRVMPSGPTGEMAADLLESRQMADLVKVLRDRYDVVIFDAPPVGSVSDALTLARVVDTGVLVVRSGRSDKHALGWTRHLLRNVGADLAGVVLTFAERQGGERYYSYTPSA